MTKPTDTSESTIKFGIFREDATNFTVYECLQGKTYSDQVGAEIALDELKQDLPKIEHNRLMVKKLV
jgi:hypothetical protein